MNITRFGSVFIPKKQSAANAEQPFKPLGNVAEMFKAGISMTSGPNGWVIETVDTPPQITANESDKMIKRAYEAQGFTNIQTGSTEDMYKAAGREYRKSGEPLPF